eukprot:Em0003g1594a
MTEQEVTKMKLIRAGHKPSITQIIAQALESSWNQPSGTRRNCMKKHLQLLKGKLEIIEKLDAQILESLETEDEITGEIEKADILKESIAMTMIDLETALREQKNDAPSQSRTAQDRTDEPRQENGARPGTPDSRDTREGSYCNTFAFDAEGSAIKFQYQNKCSNLNDLQKLLFDDQLDSKVVYPQAQFVQSIDSMHCSDDDDAVNWIWLYLCNGMHHRPRAKVYTSVILAGLIPQSQSLLERSLVASSRSHCRTYSVYEKAITVLKKRFGNKQQLINKHVEALLSLLAVTSVYEFRNLRQLYDKVESHVRSLKSIGVAASSCGNLLASILMKIPSDLCLIRHDCDLDQRLKKFWNLETLGIKEGEMPAYNQFIEGITFQEGRYCVQLPWKSTHLPPPDNFNLSQLQLRGLLKHLRQEPSLLQQYDTVIKEQLKEGIVKAVQDPWTSIGEKVHYMLHHGVV